LQALGTSPRLIWVGSTDARRLVDSPGTPRPDRRWAHPAAL